MVAGGQQNSLSIGQCATLACVLEATASKPGNVHRGADFEQLKFCDLMVGAVAIAPALQRAVHSRVGATVLAAVRATRALVHTNTNLGTLLLLAPLAAVKPDQTLRAGIGAVLDSLDEGDARQIYQAIRLAEPGGMGRVEQMDVAGAAPANILTAMRAAAQRDLVARQYTHQFEQVFDAAAAWVLEGRQSGWTLTHSVIHTHVRLMAAFPDSLIARKCGQQLAEESAQRAAAVLRAGLPGSGDYEQAVADLDFWLRSDSNRRNPGTTADLIAAGLFVLLREGLLPPPFE